MKQTDLELLALRRDLDEMWKLVISQMEKTKTAFIKHDIELAHEVISREKRVNAFDSKIDSDCENYIALYAPVAIDLRLVLSLIKISNTLERIGDFAEGIARQILEKDYPQLEDKLLEDLQVARMFDIVNKMLVECYIALESENTKLAGRILATDNQVDQLYHDSMPILAQYINAHPELAVFGLKTLLVIRKLERVGDHCSNIIEEIVFYIDAQVLKHTQVKETPQ